MRLFLAALLLVAAPSVAAQLFSVVVAGGSANCQVGTPLDHPTVEWLDILPEPHLVDVNAIAPAPGGRVDAVINPLGPDFFVAEIRPNGTQTPLTAPVVGTPQGLVVAGSGAVHGQDLHDRSQHRRHRVIDAAVDRQLAEDHRRRGRLDRRDRRHAPGAPVPATGPAALIAIAIVLAYAALLRLR